MFPMGIKILFLQNTDINNECREAIPVLKCFAGLRPKLSKFLSTHGNLGKLKDKVSAIQKVTAVISET